MKTGLAGASLPRFRKGRPLAPSTEFQSSAPSYASEEQGWLDWFGSKFDEAIRSFAHWYIDWMKTPRGAAINEFCSTWYGALLAVGVAVSTKGHV